MNRECIFILVFFLSVISCEKEKTNPEPDNNKSNLELSIEIVHGNNQTGVYNSLLQDSLVVKVSDKNGNPVSKVPLKFELTSGGGNISPTWAITDSLGLVTAKWTMGCNIDINVLGVYLTDSIANKIDSVTFTANNSLPNGWGKSCGVKFADPYEKVFREHNGTIYLTNYYMIYTSNDGGISWQEYENMPPLSMHSYIFDIQFNSKGWMYVVSRNDGIFYTEDHATWHQINNGILDYRYPTTFLVEDTCLFVSFDFSGLHRSTDNGQLWEKLLIDGYSIEVINRHPNGGLYLFDRRDRFWHSTDNGDSWVRIPLNNQYTRFKVYDFAIDKDGFLYIGAGDATISVLSTENYEGTIHRYYESNSSGQHINEIKIVDDIVYFNVNDNPEHGIYSSQNWARLDLGFEKQINTYHLKSDGKFLIASHDGVYYYNE